MLALSDKNKKNQIKSNVQLSRANLLRNTSMFEILLILNTFNITKLKS